MIASHNVNVFSASHYMEDYETDACHTDTVHAIQIRTTDNLMVTKLKARLGTTLTCSHA